MKLDDRGADVAGRIDLAGIGLDEQGGADARARKRLHRLAHRLRAARNVQPAFRGPLLAAFRDQAGGVRSPLQRDGDHLLGHGHLEVQRLAPAVAEGAEPLDVGVEDVPAILAKVRR